MRAHVGAQRLGTMTAGDPRSGSSDRPARRQGRVLAAGMIGNVLEWYDFAVYGFLAPILAKMFFPSDDHVASLAAAFGAFAAGFLMRPVGAAIFGHIGDRFGRRRALIVSTLCMAVPTFLIGLLPTYAAIGVAAPVLMVALRLLQGLSVGGEFTSSIVFLVEHAPPRRRALFATWAPFGAAAGTMLGSAIAAGVSSFAGEAEMLAWGWRVPFLAGIVVAVVGLIIRTGIVELKPSAPVDRSPVIDALHYHWRSIVRLVLIIAPGTISFYLFFVFTVSWLIDYVHEPRSRALDVTTAGLAAYLFFMPFCGLLADRLGRKPVLLAGVAATAIAAFPLVWLMHQGGVGSILLAQFAAAVIVGLYIGGLSATMAEIFPHGVRVSSVSIAYNLAIAVFGGTTPLIAVAVIHGTGDALSFAWYLSLMALVGLAAAWRLGDPGHIDRERAGGTLRSD